MTNQEAGEGLVRGAQRISERDLTSAWTEGDYNMLTEVRKAFRISSQETERV